MISKPHRYHEEPKWSAIGIQNEFPWNRSTTALVNERVLNTHHHRRIIMNVALSSGNWLVHRQILHFRCLEDDVLIRFRHRWDVLPRRPVVHRMSGAILSSIHESYRRDSVPMEYTAREHNEISFHPVSNSTRNAPLDS